MTTETPKLVVELVQQTVDRSTRLGTIKEKVPQMQIWARLDEHPRALVGYVGTQDDAPINLIAPDLPVEMVDEIKAQVTELRKANSQSTGPVAQRPSTEQMDELEEAEIAAQFVELEDEEES